MFFYLGHLRDNFHPYLLDPFSTEKPPLGEPVVDHEDKRVWSRLTHKKQLQDNEAIATQPSVFDDDTTLELFRPPPQYENAHRWEQDFYLH